MEIDTRDPSLYDLVIHLKCISVEEAVGIIEYALKHPRFQTTPESQKAMESLFLAAQVQAALVEEIPSAKVAVEGGELVVNIGSAWDGEKKMIAKVEQISDNLSGVKVKVRLIKP